MNERHKNICFFFSLSPEEMERFDDKNSLNGGFFAISGGIYIYIYISRFWKKEKKAVVNYSCYRLRVGLLQSNAIKEAFFLAHYSAKMGGGVYFVQTLQRALRNSSCSQFILSLSKDLFQLCFVILHWSSLNQRKLGQGCFFFFSVVVLFALTLFFFFFSFFNPPFLPEPALLLGPCSLMKSKGCQSMPPTQRGI